MMMCIHQYSLDRDAKPCVSLNMSSIGILAEKKLRENRKKVGEK